MKNIKAIETQYKMCKFRSRLEARWAVFFDAMGIRWEYEREGFELGDGIRYLPDFWLPQVNMWAEVKADGFNDHEKEKAKRLVEQAGNPVLMLVGLPDFVNYFAIEKDPWIDEGGVVVGWDYSLVNFYLDNGVKHNEHRFPCANYIPDDQPDAWPDDYAIAVEQARSARFEFDR